MKINFLGGAYQDRSLDLNAQECINLFPILDSEGGKEVLSLRGTSGLMEYCDSGNSVECRGLHVFNDNIYAVIGNTVYKVSGDVATALTTTLNTSTGNVYMANNETQIMIIDGVNGHIIASDSVSLITDISFPIPSSLTYQDGYFIITKKDTGEFYLSSLDDGTTWDATDFANAEAYADKLVTAVSMNRELWLLGEKTTEVWYNSGSSDFPFSRNTGIYIERGCAAKFSAVKGDNSLFWLADDGTIRRTSGYSAAIISTRQIEYQISRCSTVTDAIGIYYTEDGHGFYQLTFPTAGFTWVYDVSTQLWHRKTSYPTAIDGTQGRHRANCHVRFGNKNIIGDYSNGKLYYLKLDKYDDDGNQIRRVRTGQVLHSNRKYLFFNSFELDIESGVGLVEDDTAIGSGQNPQIMLDWSDDGGHSFGNEHWTSMGLIGDYGKRAIWYRLGKGRDRVFRVTISDPVKVNIIAAHVDAVQGKY